MFRGSGREDENPVAGAASWLITGQLGDENSIVDGYVRVLGRTGAPSSCSVRVQRPLAGVVASPSYDSRATPEERLSTNGEAAWP